jgi:hypothetical protein
MARSFVINSVVRCRIDNLDATVSQIKSKLSGLNAHVSVSADTSSLKSFNVNVQNTNSIINSISKNASAASQALGNIGRNTGGITAFNRAVTGMGSDLNKLKTQTASVSDEFVKFGLQVGQTARRYTAFALFASAFYAVGAAAKEGVAQAVKFDRELVRIAQVGGDSAKAIKSISEAVSGLSTSLGVSSQELIETATTLRQAGLSANEVKDALSSLAKTSLTPTFKSIKNTTEGVIALRQQFGITGKEIESVLGSINTVSAQFAVESDDLVTAISKAGGAFRAASSDMIPAKEQFQQLISLFTSVRSTTRESADSIATSFRTIFARLQSNEVSKNLKEMGINLRYTADEAKSLGQNVEGQFVGAYDAIGRLSTAVKNIPTTDPRFAAVIEQIGGQRQVSKVIPLLQQYTVTQKALGVAQSGTTSLTKDAALAQEALITKVTKLKEEFFDLIRVFGENKTFKSFVGTAIDMATAFTKLAKALEPVVPLLATVAAVQTFRAASFIVPAISRGVGGQRYASGGVVPGSGSGDIVPASVQPGSFVIKKSSARQFGYGNLAKLANTRKGYATGGTVDVMLEPQEYVFTPNEVKNIGSNKLKRINSGTHPMLAMPNFSMSDNPGRDERYYRLHRAMKIKQKIASAKAGRDLSLTDMFTGGYASGGIIGKAHHLIAGGKGVYDSLSGTLAASVYNNTDASYYLGDTRMMAMMAAEALARKGVKKLKSKGYKVPGFAEGGEISDSERRRRRAERRMGFGSLIGTSKDKTDLEILREKISGHARVNHKLDEVHSLLNQGSDIVSPTASRLDLNNENVVGSLQQQLKESEGKKGVPKPGILEGIFHRFGVKVGNPATEGVSGVFSGKPSSELKFGSKAYYEAKSREEAIPSLIGHREIIDRDIAEVDKLRRAGGIPKTVEDSESLVTTANSNKPVKTSRGLGGRVRNTFPQDITDRLQQTFPGADPNAIAQYQEVPQSELPASNVNAKFKSGVISMSEDKRDKPGIAEHELTHAIDKLVGGGSHASAIPGHPFNQLGIQAAVHVVGNIPGKKETYEKLGKVITPSEGLAHLAEVVSNPNHPLANHPDVKPLVDKFKDTVVSAAQQVAPITSDVSTPSTDERIAEYRRKRQEIENGANTTLSSPSADRGSAQSLVKKQQREKLERFMRRNVGVSGLNDSDIGSFDNPIDVNGGPIPLQLHDRMSGRGRKPGSAVGPIPLGFKKRRGRPRKEDRTTAEHLAAEATKNAASSTFVGPVPPGNNLPPTDMATGGSPDDEPEDRSKPKKRRQAAKTASSVASATTGVHPTDQKMIDLLTKVLGAIEKGNSKKDKATKVAEDSKKSTDKLVGGLPIAKAGKLPPFLGGTPKNVNELGVDSVSQGDIPYDLISNKINGRDPGISASSGRSPEDVYGLSDMHGGMADYYGKSVPRKDRMYQGNGPRSRINNQQWANIHDYANKVFEDPEARRRFVEHQVSHSSASDTIYNQKIGLFEPRRGQLLSSRTETRNTEYRLDRAQELRDRRNGLGNSKDIRKMSPDDIIGSWGIDVSSEYTDRKNIKQNDQPDVYGIGPNANRANLSDQERFNRSQRAKELRDQRTAKKLNPNSVDKKSSIFSRLRVPGFDAVTNKLSKFGTVGLGVAAVGGGLSSYATDPIFGTPDQIGKFSSTSIKSGAALSGTLAGAGSGAAIGSVFGPWGTAIGGAVGALAGFTKGLVDAENEIKQVEIEKDLKKFGTALEDILSGKSDFGSKLHAVNTGLAAANKAAAITSGGTLATEQSGLTVRPLESIYDFFKTTVTNKVSSTLGYGNVLKPGEEIARNRENDFAKARKAQLEPLLPSLTGVAEGVASKIKLTNGDISNARDSKDFSGVQQKLEQSGIGNVVSSIAEAKGTSIKEVYESLHKVAIAANQETQIREKGISVLNQQLVQSQQLLRISQSFGSAASSLHNLQANADALASSFDNVLSASPAVNHSANLEIGGIDGEAFNKSTDFVSNSIGGRAGDSLGRTAKGVNRAFSALPDVLSNVASQGLSGDNLQTATSKSLDSSAFDDVPKEIKESLRNVLDSIDPKDLEEAIKNPERLAGELLAKGFGNISETLQKAGKELEDRLNGYSQGLVKHQEMLNASIQGKDKLNNLNVNAMRSQSRLFAESNGRPSDAGNIPLATELRPFQLNQQNLTGLSAKDSLSSDKIGETLQETRKQIEETETKKQKAGSGQEAGNIDKELITLQGTANRLNQALGNLADSSSRNALIQEKINKLEEDKAGRTGYTEKFLTSDAAGRRDMMHGAALTDVAVQQGHFGGFNDRQRQAVLGHLDSVANVRLQGPKYDNTLGKDVKNNLIQNTGKIIGVGGFDPNNEKQRVGLIGQQAKNDTDAVKAQDLINKDKDATQDKFFNKLESIQQKFFDKLQENLTESTKKDLSAQIGTSSGELGKTQAARSAVGDIKSQGFDLSTARKLAGDENFTKLQKNIKLQDSAPTDVANFNRTIGNVGNVGVAGSGSGQKFNLSDKYQGDLAVHAATHLGVDQSEARTGFVDKLVKRTRDESEKNPGKDVNDIFRENLSSTAKEYGESYKDKLGRDHDEATSNLSRNIYGVGTSRGDKKFDEAARGIDTPGGLRENLAKTSSFGSEAELNSQYNTQDAKHQDLTKQYAEISSQPKSNDQAVTTQSPQGASVTQPSQQGAIVSTPAQVNNGPMQQGAIIRNPGNLNSGGTPAQGVINVGGNNSATVPVAGNAQTPYQDAFRDWPQKSNQLAGVSTSGGYRRSARQQKIDATAATARANRKPSAVASDGKKSKRQQGIDDKTAAATAQSEAFKEKMRRRSFTPMTKKDREEYNKENGSNIGGGGFRSVPPINPTDTKTPNNQSSGPAGLGEQVAKLDATISNFAKVISSLKIPDSISLKRDGKIEVVFNGVETLAKLESTIKEMANKEAMLAINEQLPRALGSLSATA